VLTCEELKGTKMNLLLLTTFVAAASCQAFSPPSRGTFAPPSSGEALNPNLIEGDIAVPESHDGSPLASEAFLSDRALLWPRGRVPYRLETYMWDGVEEPVFSDDQIENITQALGQISREVPCIEFRAVGTNFKGPHLVFSLMGDDRNPAGSCFSYVGRVQGKNQGKGQLVNLGMPRCLSIGIILHETLHALGAVHEHSRHDRDLFLFIVYGNIQPNALHNFRKVTKETHSTRNTPFDPSSLMMFGPNEFGIMDSNGTRTTIKPVNKGS
jgi:hypothetical protein